MPQYTLAAGSLTSTTLPAAVASVYNVGISDGTRYYGYLFSNNGAQSNGFKEKTDVATKDALVNYGSPNLVDRDLVYVPRVSQGDFSGGGGQVVFIDPARYFDSDLNTAFAGAVGLNRAWTTTSLGTGSGHIQCLSLNDKAVIGFGKADYYFLTLSSGGTTTTTAGISTTYMDTDGAYLYYGDGSAIKRANADGTAETAVVTAAHDRFWVVDEGTNGWFLYYSNGGTALNKLDLSSLPATPVAVPIGGALRIIVDIVPYQTGIAILTQDQQANYGWLQVWYHDGTNLTNIVRENGLLPLGMCECLGDLYITALQVSESGIPAPQLLHVGGGTVEVAINFTAPTVSPNVFSGATIPRAGQPRSAGKYVYFPVHNVPLGVIGSQFIMRYDVEHQVGSHLAVSGTPFNVVTTPTLSGIRRWALVQSNPVVPTYSGVAGNPESVAYTQNNLPATSGWLVSSRIDFATPAIEKRFRTIEVNHSALVTGQSITVKAFVDLDPYNFTTSLVPNPTTATVTNSTVGSTTTTLTMGSNTVGHTLYYAIQVVGPGTTSPLIYYTAIEVGGTWVWTFEFDCTFKRRTLQQLGLDQQGVSGKDLYFLLRNAYENGTLLTLYLSESVSYTVTVESLEGDSIAYSDKNTDSGRVLADQEWMVKCVLREVGVPG